MADKPGTKKPGMVLNPRFKSEALRLEDGTVVRKDEPFPATKKEQAELSKLRWRRNKFPTFIEATYTVPEPEPVDEDDESEADEPIAPTTSKKAD